MQEGIGKSVGFIQDRLAIVREAMRSPLITPAKLSEFRKIEIELNEEYEKLMRLYNLSKE